MDRADRADSTVRPGPSRAFTTTVLVAIGVLTLVTGVWAVVAPRSFAEFVDFGYAPHFVRDIGALQIGTGITLMLAAGWADAAAVVLAGFFVGNTVHTANHVVDLDIGGHGLGAGALGVTSVLVLAALVVRMRQLGWVAGAVPTAAAPGLVPFVRQKTILLTSYRRDGRPVGAPVSVVVDGDRAYVRSPGSGGKVKRIRNNPIVEISPCTSSGTATGPAVGMHARLLEGAEFRHASRLLARKYPMLQGVFVPLAHRLGRAKFGRTAHLALTPIDDEVPQRPATP
jgi:PPOX class probable F420-dependent enzyme